MTAKERYIYALPTYPVYPDSVEEAKYHVSNVLEEMTDEKKEEIAAKLDAMGLQDDMDCWEEGDKEHEDYMFCDPNNIDQQEEVHKPKEKRPMMRAMELPTDEELKAKRKIAEQRAEMAKRLAEREQARVDIQKEAAGDLDAEGEDQLKESVITIITSICLVHYSSVIPHN